MSFQIQKGVAQQEDARFRVMRLLESNPHVSQREIAALVGISLGRAHYVLSALIEVGFVKIANFQAARDKGRYAYILTPQGVIEKASITRRFLERKVAEYEALEVEIEALRREAQPTKPGPEGDAEQN